MRFLQPRILFVRQNLQNLRGVWNVEFQSRILSRVWSSHATRRTSCRMRGWSLSLSAILLPLRPTVRSSSPCPWRRVASPLPPPSGTPLAQTPLETEAEGARVRSPVLSALQTFCKAPRTLFRGAPEFHRGGQRGEGGIEEEMKERVGGERKSRREWGNGERCA